jgi:Na+/H+ antiporter NhaD/arsenite permease-like protein
MSIWNRVGLAILVLPFFLGVAVPVHGERAHPGRGKSQSDRLVTLTLVGRVVSTQDVPVEDAEIRLLIDSEIAGLDRSDEDGFYILETTLDSSVLEAAAVTVEIEKAGFRTVHQDYTQDHLLSLDDCCFAHLPDTVLPRVVNAAFLLATAIFVLVFVVISLNLLHETVAAFLGATAMLAVTYLVGTFNADYWIIGFARAVDFVDLDVIFLIMTLMIVVSIMGRTGVFQWLALEAYRMVGGHAWRLAIILMIATALMSAFLNNVTIMLLMAPITIEIALMLGINPTALIIPEALASNVGGIATLIGDPPNTIIGSYAGLGFNQFLIHMGPMAILAAGALIVAVWLIYRRHYAGAGRAPSPALMTRLEKDAQIRDPVALKRVLLVVGLMLVLFFLSELFHMPSSVVGLIGATILLVWVRPDVEEMLSEVDWTTLMFFICLFIVVGGVQEVGLIQLIAELIAGMAGDSLFAATMAVIWLSAGASAIVNNIPFTTAFLPIAAYLTATIPGASNNVLYWSLSLGANLGGNATYVGSAPNVVAAGYLERAGYRVEFKDWLKVGVPVALVTILVPTVWILVHYFWLQF